MDSSKHILTVDVGSSSVRCSLYDGTGTLVKGTGASFPHGFATTRDGEATLDAEELCELVFRRSTRRSVAPEKGRRASPGWL